MKRARFIAFLALLSCLHAARGEGTERKIVMDPYAYPHPTQDAHQPHAQQTDCLAQLPEDLYPLMAQFVDLHSLQTLRQTSKAHMKHVNAYMTPRVVMAVDCGHLPTLDMFSSRGFNIRQIKHVQLLYPHNSWAGDTLNPIPFAKIRDWLQNFSALEQVDLVGDPYEFMDTLAYLRTDTPHLKIRDPRALSDADLKGMRLWTFLTELHLVQAQITEESLIYLSQLTNLTSLYLSHDIQITDSDLGFLRPLTRLTNLSLGHTQITDDGLAYLNTLLNLKSLHLRDSQITDERLAHLSALTNLTDLSLNQTKITGAGLVHLEKLTKLTELNLLGTPITNAGLVHLQALTNLGGLYLCQTQVTDEGLPHLYALPNLFSLVLPDRWIPEPGLFPGIPAQGIPGVTDQARETLRRHMPHVRVANVHMG